MFWNLIAFIAGYEAANWLMSLKERESLVRLARLLAGGKPLLVVGNPKGRHEAGSLCIDLEPVCPCVRANVEHLDDIPDGAFGAAFVGHVLEHVDNPARAWAELHRVADHVVIAYPYTNTLICWLHPDHKWVILRADDTLEFMENPVRALMTEAFSTRSLPRLPASTRRV